MTELVGHVKTAREQDVHHNPGLVPGTFFIEDPKYRQESQDCPKKRRTIAQHNYLLHIYPTIIYKIEDREVWFCSNVT